MQPAARDRQSTRRLDRAAGGRILQTGHGQLPPVRCIVNTSNPLVTRTREHAMLENMKFKSSNYSGSWAAAWMIFSVGLFGLAASAMLAFRQTPEVAIYVLTIGGGLALLSLILRMRPELPSECLWLFSRGRHTAAPDYVPRIIRSAPTTFGTNHPPTVEEIRELKDSPRTWVPSQSCSGRQSLRRGTSPSM
jgi:hypothetical protein